jgi:hypothetical protein
MTDEDHLSNEIQCYADLVGGLTAPKSASGGEGGGR